MLFNVNVLLRPGFRRLSAFNVFFFVFFCIAYTQVSGQSRPLVFGTDEGLFSLNQNGTVQSLWQSGKVHKILAMSGSAGWLIQSDRGIFASDNLKDWEPRNGGLPERVIKIFENGEKSFVSTVREIKDIEINPADAEIMVCALKDTVYLSRNGGRQWESLGMPYPGANGIKAVAAVTIPGAESSEAGTLSGAELAVFCSHSIYGLYYITPLKPGAKWTELNAGLELLETSDSPDEVSDITVSIGRNGTPLVYASQTFRRRIYQLDWNRKSWTPLWSDDLPFGALDSLQASGGALRFVRDGGIAELRLTPSAERGGLPLRERGDITSVIRNLRQRPNCILMGGNRNSDFSADDPGLVCLSELWLLDENFDLKAQTETRNNGAAGRAAKAAGREGLYLPVNHAMDETSLAPYLDIIEKRNLNMVVVDMKDDYGRLRFTPKNTGLLKLGRVFWPLNVEALLETLKTRGIYTVARIVVFKDPEAARKEGQKYAVWDRANNKPWQGYYDTHRKKNPEHEDNPALVTERLPADDPEYEILRTWYDEKWVDPYSEVIWDYNASVAEELYLRGFDEIQFDYIRFPTDGVNLRDASYRWREEGMDMDSAVSSFLRHVRGRVDAPISVDIYGANGWYRTGARTGQEVELLSPWVDVICPMYYPSHFEQTFLAQKPAERRPYRIYNHGTMRTRVISRGRVTVRPWAQAFYLNVSYDRKYYNADYVRMQAEGVRAAGDGGLTYWNNSGRYNDIPFTDINR